jgi:hypothetical protein
MPVVELTGKEIGLVNGKDKSRDTGMDKVRGGTVGGGEDGKAGGLGLFQDDGETVLDGGEEEAVAVVVKTSQFGLRDARKKLNDV